MFWELGCRYFEQPLFPYTQRWHLEEKEDRDVCLPMKNLFVSSGKIKQGKESMLTINELLGWCWFVLSRRQLFQIVEISKKHNQFILSMTTASQYNLKMNTQLGRRCCSSIASLSHSSVCGVLSKVMNAKTTKKILYRISEEKKTQNNPGCSKKPSTLACVGSERN